MTEVKISSAIKGAIGEFYVASYLSAMGLIVALPRAGVPGSDLLVTTADGHKTISLQIKTSLYPLHKSTKDGNHWAWNVSAKARNGGSHLHWYVFVNGYNWPTYRDAPDLYFVPSEEVARIVTDWNVPESSMQFFRILEGNEQALYSGVEGFKKMMLALRVEIP